MVRNFSIVKGSPCRPGRSWRKSTGLPSRLRTRAASTAIGTASTVSAEPATTTSAARFVRCQGCRLRAASSSTSAKRPAPTAQRQLLLVVPGTAAAHRVALLAGQPRACGARRRRARRGSSGAKTRPAPASSTSVGRVAAHAHEDRPTGEQVGLGLGRDGDLEQRVVAQVHEQRVGGGEHLPDLATGRRGRNATLSSPSASARARSRSTSIPPPISTKRTPESCRSRRGRVEHGVECLRRAHGAGEDHGEVVAEAERGRAPRTASGSTICVSSLQFWMTLTLSPGCPRS